MPMRGLTVIVADDDAARFDAALTLVAAQGALGGRARIYLHGAAVRLLGSNPIEDIARDLGVAIIACQTALDTHDIALPDTVEGGGMVALLTDLSDDRLVFA